jgi:hypothetical protein
VMRIAWLNPSRMTLRFIFGGGGCGCGNRLGIL